MTTDQGVPRIHRRRFRHAFLALAIALVVLLAVGVIWYRASDDAAEPAAGSAPTTVESTATSTAVTAGPGTTAMAPTTRARSPVAPTTSVAPTTLRSSTPVRQGTWGGRGIKLVLTATGGSVEYECAAGVIGGPLVVTAGGTFEATGTHTVLRGGPPDPTAAAPRAQPARYSGSVDGMQMRLTVSLPEAGTTLGPFSLGFDQQPLLDRCG